MPESLKLRYLSYVPSLRKWRETHSGSYQVFFDKESLYQYINKDILGDVDIDYLEFGVFEGESIMKWAGLNTRPGSRFYGFDTFTGLPETWNKFSTTVSKNAFDTGGAIPQVKDKRISFYKGLFQETLNSFLKDFSNERPLVVHIDCDLYSAALFVMTQLDKVAKPGTIIIFDEFTSLLHEFRALEDYCQAYLRDYSVLGSTQSEIQVAIKML